MTLTDEKLDVDIRSSGNVDGREIAPLILLPFVGKLVSNTVPAKPDAIVGEADDRCARRSFGHQGRKQQSQRERKKGHIGIGIRNVKRRLDLLYPGKHDLKIIDGEETFLVVLTIGTSFPVAQQTSQEYQRRISVEELV